MGTLARFAGCPLMVVGILGPLRSGRAEQEFGMLLEEAISCPSNLRCLGCFRLPVSPPFQNPCCGTLPLGRAVLTKRPRGAQVLLNSPATEGVLPWG